MYKITKGSINSKDRERIGQVGESYKSKVLADLDDKHSTVYKFLNLASAKQRYNISRNGQL